MLMLCKGTLTSAHTAKQVGELNYSTCGESRRMGQEKGECVRKTHTLRIGEEEEAIGKHGASYPIL